MGSKSKPPQLHTGGAVIAGSWQVPLQRRIGVGRGSLEGVVLRAGLPGWSPHLTGGGCPLFEVRLKHGVCAVRGALCGTPCALVYLSNQYFFAVAVHPPAKYCVYAETPPLEEGTRLFCVFV